MARDYRQDLTDKIIEALEGGTAPWQKPWNGIEPMMPFNPVSGTVYRGGNVIALMMRGYEDPRWCTYKQAEAMGWQVQKGEKSTLIEFWKFHDEVEREDETTGEKKKVRVALERPIVRYANVFNVAQMQNVPELDREQRGFEWAPLEVAERILAQSAVPIFHDQADRAFYSVVRDQIHLPPKDAFEDATRYYSTALHELGHASGHPTRLNRQMGNSFGSVEYAKEELRAEMASLFLSYRLGVPFDVGQHAAYVGSWISVLKEDKNELFRAARDAEQIAEYLVGLGREQSLALEAEHGRDPGHLSAAQRAFMRAQNPAYPAIRLANGAGEWDEVVKPLLVKGLIEADADRGGYRFTGAGLRARAEAQEARVREVGQLLPAEIRAAAETFDAQVAARFGQRVPDADDSRVVHLRNDFLREHYGTDKVAVVTERQSAPVEGPLVLSRGGRAYMFDLASGQVLDFPSSTLGAVELGERYSVSIDNPLRPSITKVGRAPAAVEPTTKEFPTSEMEVSKFDQLVDLKSVIKELRVVQSPGDLKAFCSVVDERYLNQTLVMADSDWATFTEAVRVKAASLEPRTERINLNVPFGEKEEVKRLGAKWDKDKKTWYIPGNIDRAPFERWVEAPRELTQNDIRQQFRNALVDAGLVIDGDPEMDGKWHRTTVTTSKKVKALKGAYIAHIDNLADDEIPNGFIQNFDTGYNAPWFPEGLMLNDEQRRQFEVQAAENRRLREQQLAAEREQVAQRLSKKWESLPDLDAHPYLDRKQVEAFGLKRQGDKLVTPARDADGKIWSLQYIPTDPRQIKLFEKGGQKTGNFHVLGDLNASDIVLFGEGYATCASLHMATGLPVVETFDSGNIAPVLAALAPRLEGKSLLVCGDDDVLTPARVLKTLNNIVSADHMQPKLQVAEVAAAELIVDGKPHALASNPKCTMKLEYKNGPEGVQRVVGEFYNEETKQRVPVLINNVGREKALAAAGAHKAMTVFPVFTSLDGGPSDFNDLHVREGLDQVCQQLAPAIQHARSAARSAEQVAKEALGADAVVVQPKDNSRYVGPVLGNTESHAVQDVGRRTAVAHDLGKLDRAPAVGKSARITYQDGRGVVHEAGQGHSQAKGAQR